MVSSFVVILSVGTVAILLTFLYASYWAFSIRRALAARIYRNQALGLFLISLMIAVSSFFLPLFVATSNFLFFVAFLVAITAANITTMYWVDASVLAARLSDPLLRDTLSWRRVRIPYWGVFAIFMAFNLPFQFGLVGKNLPAFVSTAFIAGPLILAATAGAVYLPISAKRSMDLTLRRHMKWFGLFIACLFLGIVPAEFILGGPSISESIISSPGIALAGYCLYRSAKSLAPLNRLSSDTETK